MCWPLVKCTLYKSRYPVNPGDLTSLSNTNSICSLAYSEGRFSPSLYRLTTAIVSTPLYENLKHVIIQCFCSISLSSPFRFSNLNAIRRKRSLAANSSTSEALKRLLTYIPKRLTFPTVVELNLLFLGKRQSRAALSGITHLNWLS